MKRFVFSSTCATFGTPERVPIDETLPQRPINPYGESKLIFEQILRWYGDIHGLRYVALRYFNAAGATENYGEDHRIETHLIPNVLKVALGQKEHVSIFGTDYETPDGTCIRDYIHIVDLAQAHMLALSVEQSAKYNLGTGGGTSVREIIAACEKVTGKKIAVREEPRRAGDPARLIAGSDKIQRELGWKPKFQSIEKIIESAWAWHQRHPVGTGIRAGFAVPEPGSACRGGGGEWWVKVMGEPPSQALAGAPAGQPAQTAACEEDVLCECGTLRDPAGAPNPAREGASAPRQVAQRRSQRRKDRPGSQSPATAAGGRAVQEHAGNGFGMAGVSPRLPLPQGARFRRRGWRSGEAGRRGGWCGCRRGACNRPKGGAEVRARRGWRGAWRDGQWRG